MSASVKQIKKALAHEVSCTGSVHADVRREYHYRNHVLYIADDPHEPSGDAYCGICHCEDCDGDGWYSDGDWPESRWCPEEFTDEETLVDAWVKAILEGA